ncbi:type II secretion system F family protein [Candidatus Omnitrophota bacterium]
MNLNISFEKKTSMKQLLHFTRQLSILISAGAPLINSLHTIYEQLPEGQFKEIVRKIVKEIEEGSPLSVALSKYPQIFSNLFVNMIKAGEVGGMLPAILKRVDHFLNHSHRLRQKIRLAAMYPIFVLVIAIIILTALTAFVVPSFIKIFADLGGELPVATQILVVISSTINRFWFLIPFVFVLFVVLYQVSKKNLSLKLFMDRARLRLPVIGLLVLNIEVSRFSRLLGTLLMSGVPILESLKIAADTSDNYLFASAIESARKSIEKGDSVYSSMEEHDIFPKILTRMISVGEESGQLDKILLQIADEYEEEAEDSITSLTSLLEPLLIVAMGIIVGFIVVALFFPIFTMGSLVK